jgi:hypothetical protein
VDRFSFHTHRAVESGVAGAVHDESVVDQKVKQGAPYAGLVLLFAGILNHWFRTG